MSTITTDRIEKQVLLRHPRSRVWRALTDSREFGTWFGALFTEPFKAGARVLSAEVPCRPCSTKGSARCPRGHHQCMQQVTVAQVCTAASALWGGHTA